MLKRILPHLIAIAVFASLTVVYFMPYYQDMTLSQGDVTQWEGMSHEIVEWNKAHPEDPALWTDAMFGGMPAVQISMLFSGNFVTKVYHVISALFPSTAAFMFMMFLGFYILLLCLDVNPWLSIAGSIAYGLSSFTIISIEAGHNTKVQAMSLMAPALGGVILAYRKNIIIGGAITALFLSMAIDSNHMQITYYLLMMLGVTGVYFFINAILEKTIPHFAKATGVLVVAGLLAVLPNVANLWTTQEYGKETMRGGSSELSSKKEALAGGGLDFDYATRWSEGFTDGEFLSILIPNIKGGVSGGSLDEDSYTYKEMLNKGVQQNMAERYIKQMPLYWGAQPFTSGPVYFGAAIVFLFIFSLLIVRSNIKWALLTLTTISLLLSFGHYTPFYKMLFNLLPLFNKFRTPAMGLVIAQLAMPLLAMLGINEIINGQVKQDDILKKLKIAGGITAGIVILFGLLGGMFVSFTSDGDKQYYEQGNGWLIDALKKDRASLLHADAIRSLFFIATVFALVWFYVKKKLNTQVFVGAVAVMFLIDGWMVAKRYLNNDNFVESSKYATNHTETQADHEILDHDALTPQNQYRVFNTTRDPFNDAMTSYYHKSVGGYHAAKLIRYQDLIENQISKYNMHVLDMLNTKYIMVADPKTKEPMVQRNPGALGNAWFVNEIKWVKNADEEMAALTNFDPKNTLVVDERYKKEIPDNAIGNDSAKMIKLLEYTPNHLKYATNSSANQVAVFSEIFYDNKKGWNAYLDGKVVEHFRADYVLRALAVPAGAHNIEFKFEPKSIVEGNKISYAGSFLLFIFVFGTLGFSGYKKMKEIEAEPKPEPKPVQPPVTKVAKKK